jgi:dihydroflavonol-4-reductase
VRILVTGATGFLGCHVTAALVTAGHEVRAFARSADRVERAMEPFGVSPAGVAVGDVTDRRAVDRAVAGCEAVIHSASVYSYDPRRASEMELTNLTGTENVLEAAVEAGCDPVVYVSTAQTAWPATGRVDGDPPLSPADGMPYADSKKAAEKVARRWQQRGAPVATTYPGGILGPHDPGPGEQISLLRVVLGPSAPFRIDGGFPLCDIDWVTRVHAGLVEPGGGPRRITCSGTYITWTEWFELARRTTGRALRTPVAVPRWMLKGMGSAMDLLQRAIPSRLPFGAGPAWVVTESVPMADTEAMQIAGAPPPLEETFTRAVRWAVEAGHIHPRQAGDLAPS